MPETHAFKVRAGWVHRLGIALAPHSADLVLRPDCVQLNDEVLLSEEIHWIRLQIMTLVQTGVKMGTTSTLELGGAHRSLRFSLHDMLYSRVRTSTFSEIWSVVYRFYGSRIIREMLDILAAGGSFSVGKVRFRPEGLEVPKKLLFISGDLQLVPWPSVRCQTYRGDVQIKASDDRSLRASESLWKTRNACFIEPLVDFVRGMSRRAARPGPTLRESVLKSRASM